MAGGVVLGGKKYSGFEYFQVFLITLGVCIFNLMGKKKGGEDSLLGLCLIGFSLVMDAVTGGLQDKVKKRTKELNPEAGEKPVPTMHESMLWTNLSGTIVAFALAIVTGQITSGLAFCMRNPEVINAILVYSLASAVGQVAAPPPAPPPARGEPGPRRPFVRLAGLTCGVCPRGRTSSTTRSRSSTRSCSPRRDEIRRRSAALMRRASRAHAHRPRVTGDDHAQDLHDGLLGVPQPGQQPADGAVGRVRPRVRRHAARHCQAGDTRTRKPNLPRRAGPPPPSPNLRRG